MYKSWVALATVFCVVAPKIYGPSVWNILDVTPLVPNFVFLLIFMKIYAPLMSVIYFCFKTTKKYFKPSTILLNLSRLWDQYNYVTDDPGSNPDQKYVRRRDRRNYSRKSKVQI
jgi:hypothetical protein